MELTIRRAVAGDADELTEIAHAAKRRWGYPEEWIALWRADLTLTPEYIAREQVHVAGTQGHSVGVYALVSDGGDAEIEHLWVRPAYMGKGVGRALFEHAASLARSWSACRIRIVSDPNASGFYRRLGAREVGFVDSTPRGRRMPVLEFDLDSSSGATTLG